MSQLVLEIWPSKEEALHETGILRLHVLTIRSENELSGYSARKSHFDA